MRDCRKALLLQELEHEKQKVPRHAAGRPPAPSSPELVHATEATSLEHEPVEGRQESLLPCSQRDAA